MKRQIRLGLGMVVMMVSLLLPCSAQETSDSIHIAHYDLHLNITDFTTHYIGGYAELQVVSKVDDLQRFTLDLAALTTDSIFIDGVRCQQFSHRDNALHIELQSVINHNDTARVRIYYHGQPASGQGFGGFLFRGEYAYNIGVSMDEIPHGYGRAWYPCIDSFTDKSTYTFHIETTQGKRAICGGRLCDSIATTHNTTIWRWELEQPIPTYLASVAVGSYAHYRDTVQGLERRIPIDIFVYPDKINRVEGTFARLKEIFQLFEQRFGPYRWNRVGYVDVRFDYGAMEHATNIAYPSFAINGTDAYESLYAHELSHAWFGNLTTCMKAEEMWINEGFARYSESLVAEGPINNIIDEDAYRNYIHDMHMGVLASAHIDDNGYWALNQVPQSNTYGSTSYDKGGITVHALRKYMGDSLFFGAVKSMFAAHPYGNITSEALFEHFANYSQMSLSDFFENYVNQPGFLHFSVDSLCHLSGNEYKFYVRQRKHHALHLGNNVRIDITFFSAAREQYTLEDFTFSGANAEGVLSLPFIPLFAVVDYHEKLVDATADINHLITEATTYGTRKGVNLIVNLTEARDTTFMRLENNFATIDTPSSANSNIYKMVQTHYWRVMTTCDANLSGSMRFYYNATTPLHDDYEGLHGYSRNDLILLYRRDASESWRIIPSQISGSSTQGCLISTQVMSGEYAIGVGNRSVATTELPKRTFSVYPNPTHDSITVVTENPTCKEAYWAVMDMHGKVIQTQKATTNKSVIALHALPAGTYLLHLICDGISIGEQKIIKK